MILIALLCLAGAGAQASGPYPAFGGISAAADDASVAGQNPAGMTYFDERVSSFELTAFFTESTWEERVGQNGPVRVTENDGSTVIPLAAVVMPFRERWWLGLTFQGSGFSEDVDANSPLRFFNTDYSLLYVSAFPSIATRLGERLSVAASLALTYVSYEQNNAIPNFEPGSGDGNMNIDTNDIAFGYGLSAMYQLSKRTRLGLTYRSEIDPDLEGNIRFSGLGPIAQSIIDRAGLQDVPINVSSRLPHRLTVGMLHDFENDHTVTVDLAWMEFSDFKLAEIYLDGNQIRETEPDYEDILALSASYNWPLADRWRAGVGAFWVDDMIDDEARTMTLRLDSAWGIGVGFEWQWTPGRVVTGVLNYIEIGDAPVTRQTIGGLAEVSGRYTERHAINLRIALSLGPG